MAYDPYTFSSASFATAIAPYYTSASASSALVAKLSSASFATAIAAYVTSASLATALGTYVTSSSLATVLGTYITSNSASIQLATKLSSASFVTAIAPYLTSVSAAAIYLTSASFVTAIGAYLTSASASANYLSSASAATQYITSASVATMIAASPHTIVQIASLSFGTASALRFSGTWTDYPIIDVDMFYGVAGLSNTLSLAVYTDGGTTAVLSTLVRTASVGEGGYHLQLRIANGRRKALSLTHRGSLTSLSNHTATVMAAPATLNCIQIAHGGTSNTVSGQITVYGWRGT
jgi:hypothetical protein